MMINMKCVSVIRIVLRQSFVTLTTITMGFASTAVTRLTKENVALTDSLEKEKNLVFANV